MASTKRVARPIEERFWPKVDKHGPIPQHRPELGPCWLWTAWVDRDGYGHIGRGGRDAGMAKSHRWSYEHHVGPIPDGFEIDHLCRVRRCVNPAHLEAVTHAENMRRAGLGGAFPNSKKTHCARGHAYDEKNTKVVPCRPNGRYCRKCQKINAQNRQMRRRAAKANA